MISDSKRACGAGFRFIQSRKKMSKNKHGERDRDLLDQNQWTVVHFKEAGRIGPT